MEQAGQCDYCTRVISMIWWCEIYDELNRERKTWEAVKTAPIDLGYAEILAKRQAMKLNDGVWTRAIKPTGIILIQPVAVRILRNANNQHDSIDFRCALV